MIGIENAPCFLGGPKGVKIKLHMKGDQADSMENNQKIKKVVLKGNTLTTPWMQLVEFWMIKWLLYPLKFQQLEPKKWWLEDDPFLLGFGNFSGASC